jgi:hypothetical protein
VRFACRITVIAAVLTGLLVPAAAGTGALAAASASPAPAGGTELWLARYTPPGGGGAAAIAASPDGARVYVTGKRTAAFAAATGKLLWVSPAGPGQTVATQVAVSADGARVFVTGTQTLASGASQYATVAYNAATGARLWQANYGPVTALSDASAIGVSPDGSTVFVTGKSEIVSGNTSSYRYATMAYDAATGARRWTARCCRGGLAEAVSLAVSPDAARVYVTGVSISPAGSATYATVAYDAATGAVLWDRRYVEGGTDAFARSVVASPDGSRVYVTGEAGGTDGVDDTTVAYLAASGTQLWVAHHDLSSVSGPVGMAISRNGTELVLTGADSAGPSGSGGYGYRTVAYRTSDGHQLWARFYQGPGGGGLPASMAMSPDGSKVFVTGVAAAGGPRAGRADYGTVAYGAAAGAQLWASVYSGPLYNGTDEAAAVAVSPDGSKVFVTGGSPEPSGIISYATLAYQA